MNATLNPNLTHAVPLNMLVQSKANVRKTNTKNGIEALAANIEAVGLRQNLNVRRMEDGKSEVIAGQRRLMALQLLAKQKKIPADFLVPCLEVKDEQQAQEISTAENVMREAMHPADEFEAFKGLVNSGKSVDDIAAQFGCSVLHVRKLLALSSVSPKIIAAYRKGDLNLEQVMAYTLTGDHVRQEKLFREHPAYTAWSIKKALTEDAMSGGHRFVPFVGLKNYEAAGGRVTRDLFEEDEDSVHLSDPDILRTLAEQKFNTTVEKVKAEGWGWVDADLDESYVHDSYRYGKIQCNNKKADASGYDPEEMKSAGVTIRVDHRGKLDIVRGLISPKDMKRAAREAGEAPEKSEWSARQTEELMNQHTASLRMALSGNAHVALAMLAQRMADEVFFHGTEARLIEVNVSSHDTDSQYPYAVVPNPEECAAQASLKAKMADWEKELPEDDEKLFDWCLKQTDEKLTSLIVLCTAMSLNTITPKHGYDRTEQAQKLGKALNFNMADYWQPTAAGFIGRMKKGQMMQALKDVNLPDVAFNIEKLKREAAVKVAATALAGTGWLPTMLRPAIDDGRTETA